MKGDKEYTDKPNFVPDGGTEVEDTDDHDATTTRDGVGTKIGDALGATGGWLIMLPIAILGRTVHEGTKTAASVVGTVMPFAEKPWKNLLKFAFYKYHKAAGGDAVGLIHEPSGSIEPVAVKHKSQTIDEEEAERAGWHAKGRDQSWHEAADGREVDRLGKAPVVLLDSASTQRATVTEARFAQALDLDNVEPLYQVEDEGQVDITVQMTGNGGSAGTPAMADGGAAWEATETAVRGAVFDRALVDIGAGEHDGMRIDPRKVKETYREKSGAEQLDEVERLGFLAGKLGGTDMQGFVIKVLLIALGIVAAALIGPDLLSQASSGGGGGGPVPFTIMPWGLG